jgi:hypothetical protein
LDRIWGTLAGPAGAARAGASLCRASDGGGAGVVDDAVSVEAREAGSRVTAGAVQASQGRISTPSSVPMIAVFWTRRPGSKRMA